MSNVAGKKTNGHDSSTDRMIEVLERIEKRLERIETEARATREELHGFREETREELTDLRGLVSGEREGSLEVRIAKLEAVVFRPTGT